MDLGHRGEVGSETDTGNHRFKIAARDDSNDDGDTLDEGEAEIAAPVMVTGEIEVSLGTSALITKALDNNSDSNGLTQDLFEGLDGDDADSTNGGVQQTMILVYQFMVRLMTH